MEAIEPIIHDLKDGSLKRVRKSTFDRNKRRSSEIMPTDDDDIFSDYLDENENESGSEFKESNDTSSYDNSKLKDPDMDRSRSVKSKQMRSVLQTIETAKKKLLEMSDNSNIQSTTRRSGYSGHLYGKHHTQKEINIERIDSYSPQKAVEPMN